MDKNGVLVNGYLIIIADNTKWNVNIQHHANQKSSYYFHALYDTSIYATILKKTLWKQDKIPNYKHRKHTANRC